MTGSFAGSNDGLLVPPLQLMRALKALGGIEEMPTPDELSQRATAEGGPAALRLACVRELADVVQAQLTLATDLANTEAIAAGRGPARSWLQELYDYIGPAVDHLIRQQAAAKQRGVSTDLIDMMLVLAQVLHTLLSEFPIFRDTPMGYPAADIHAAPTRLRALADTLEEQLRTS